MKELDNLSKFDPATLTPPNQPENSAQTPSVIRAESLTVGYDSRPILADLDLELERGQVTSLVGPNGSGKSTLLKGLARLLKPTGGTIYLDGQAIAHLPTVEVARRLAVLPQGPSAPPGLTVGELVEQGRYPHAGPLRMLRRQDHAAIAEALDLTGTTHFVQRPLDSLSGGEHQRAWIALALAQSTPILFLDEPTTFLDIGHQLEVLALIERLNRERQMTIVMVLHDLNQAARLFSSNDSTKRRPDCSRRLTPVGADRRIVS